MKKSLKNSYYNKQISDLHQMSGYAFSSDERSVFYAGSTENWKRADNYAEKNGIKKITRTHGGNALETLEKKDILKSTVRKGVREENTNKTKIDRDVANIWRSSSRRYAAAAKGTVKTFVSGARPGSIYRGTELPTLLNNKNIRTINGISRADLHKLLRSTYASAQKNGMSRRESVEHARAAVHRKVAIAEVRQDMHTAKATNDKALQADSLLRLSLLKEQHKAELRQYIQSRAQGKDKNQIQAQQHKQTKSGVAVANRIKSIHAHAETRYLEKGMDNEQARNAAAATARIAEQRHKLNQERKDAFEKADKASIRAYVEKQQALRQETIAARQEQARSLGQPYTGPAQMPEAFKTVDQKIKVREYYTRAQLEKNRREGHIDSKEYESLRTRNESMLSRSRQSDLTSYFEGQQQGHSASKSQSDSTSIMDADKHRAEAASYGYNFTQTVADQGHSQSQAQTHDGHAQSYHGR